MGKKKSRYVLYFLVTLVLVCVIGYERTKSGSKIVSPIGLEVAPSWKLSDFQGGTITSKDYEGKVVLVKFWATWCSTCRSMIPDLNALEEEYTKQGFAVVAMAMDEIDDGKMKTFIEGQAMRYQTVRADARTLQAFGDVNKVPTSFFVDRTGKVVAYHQGKMSKKNMEAIIKQYL